MKFLYIKINNWFEFENDEYKKLGGSYAKKNNKGDLIEFTKSSRVEPIEEPAIKEKVEKVEKPKRAVPKVSDEDFIEEEKSPLEELNG